MRTLKNTLNILSVVAFLLVCATVLGVLSVVVDFYDGLDKDKKPSDSLSSGDLTPPDTDDSTGDDESGSTAPGEEENNIYVDNLSDAVGPGYVEGLFRDALSVDATEMSKLYSKLILSIPTDRSLENMQFSPAGVYKNGSFALAMTEASLPSEFSLGTKTASVAVKVKSENDASIKVEYEETEVEVKAVGLYMGYILLYKEDLTATLCDNDLHVLLEDMDGKEPAYRRTLLGEPAFVDSEGKYYILTNDDPEIGYAFESVGQELLSVGLAYDGPVSVYENEDGDRIYAAYDPNKKVYRYYNATTGEQAINSDFSYAFDLGMSGYAFAKTTKGTYVIIDHTGKIVHQASTSTYKYYPAGAAAGYSVYVRRYYELPYFSDIGGIGSGSIDSHGWMRIRVRIVGTSSAVKNKVMEDYETLINIKGELFKLPDGFTLEGYSDGVLLLSKGGLYGYYTVDGKWIAHPIYTYARPFVQGLAVVGHQGGTLGMIDTSGNIVIPFVFTYISDLSYGTAVAYGTDGSWKLLRLMEDPLALPPVTEKEPDTEEPEKE